MSSANPGPGRGILARPCFSGKRCSVQPRSSVRVMLAKSARQRHPRQGQTPEHRCGCLCRAGVMLWAGGNRSCLGSPGSQGGSCRWALKVMVTSDLPQVLCCWSSISRPLSSSPCSVPAACEHSPSISLIKICICPGVKETISMPRDFRPGFSFPSWCVCQERVRFLPRGRREGLSRRESSRLVLARGLGAEGWEGAKAVPKVGAPPWSGIRPISLGWGPSPCLLQSSSHQCVSCTQRALRPP